jgi:hypothetical protein
MTNSKTSEPLEVCWQVFDAASSRIMRCAIFGAVTFDVELRIGYFGDAPLRSQIVPDIQSARGLAQDWLEAMRAASKDD